MRSAIRKTSVILVGIALTHSSPGCAPSLQMFDRSAPSILVADQMAGRLREHIIAEGESLFEIARRNGLSLAELRAANPNLPPQPAAGATLMLPTAHILPEPLSGGIVVNLAAHRLFHFSKSGEVPFTAAVAVGAEDHPTPSGETSVTRKVRDPVWRPTPAMREANPGLPAAVLPGPDNPLGRFALYLDWPSYLIHGTNRPESIGGCVTHGCIRLYPEAIETLFDIVEVGAPVRMIREPVSIGAYRGEIFIEAHPGPQELDQAFLTDAKSRASALAVRLGVPIDEAALAAALARRSGVPEQVSFTTGTISLLDKVEE